MRELNKKVGKKLAFDVACGFFKDEQLQIRYNLTAETLAGIKKQRAFIKEVDETKWLLADDSSEFVLKAKEYAMGALDTLRDITQDKAEPGASRTRAAGMIFALAKLIKEPGKGQGEGGHNAINIFTNLSLNASEAGSYSAVAKPATIEGQFETVPESPKYIEAGEGLI